MANTKALGVGPDRSITVLEEDPIPANIKIFRKAGAVYIEKSSFDPYVEEFKKTKGVKFALSGYSIEKEKGQAYYVFSKTLYRQIGMLLKLPAMVNLKEKK